jgi:hypothetical protein
MYASIRKYKIAPGTIGEITRRVEEGFVPIISKGPGFVAYFNINSGPDVMTTVSVFQDHTGAAKSNMTAASWVKQNVASLLPNPPEIISGEVMISKVG